MSEKQNLIKRMLELQKKFTDYELEHGVRSEEYFAAPKNHPLYGYRQEFRDLALKVGELAHLERGSHS